MTNYILTFRCRDERGIVNAVTSALLDVDANILEQAQFTDPDLKLFCMRTRFEVSEPAPSEISDALSRHCAHFAPEWSLRDESHHRRAVLMVSKFDHCLVDLLYRRTQGELPIEIPVIVSNHLDLAPLAAAHGIRFEHIPVTQESKPEAEARTLALIEECDADVVILARYMQVLSDDFCSRLPGRIINIHHSFLPGFKGARPYHQAHQRGVKIIGATAHFVTADLDEGPIIEQDVERVSHARSADSLVEVGRDVERRVLSRAIRLYSEDRILLTGTRTVVFST